MAPHERGCLVEKQDVFRKKPVMACSTLGHTHVAKAHCSLRHKSFAPAANLMMQKKTPRHTEKTCRLVTIRLAVNITDEKPDLWTYLPVQSISIH